MEKSLLNDTQEKSEKSLLNDVSKEKSNSNMENLIGKFYTHLGRNGGMIYFIDHYAVKDKEESLCRKEHKELLAIESLKGYTLEDIPVLQIDAVCKKGYVRINDSIDIPLEDLDTPLRPKYFFDKNEAIKEWKRLSNIELDFAKEILRNADAASSYLKRMIEREIR